MFEKEPYTWKFFKERLYLVSEIKDFIYCELPRTTSFLPEQDKFSSEFNSVNIPKQNYNILFKLLETIGYENQITKFITIGCCLQSYYSKFHFWANQKLFQEADRYNNEKDNLLKVLEEYLRHPDMEKVHSISFKFNRESTVSIKNKFVLLELFQAITDGYGITWDNFNEVNNPDSRNRLLATKNHEKIKIEFIKSFYDLIFPSYNSDSNTLKFIGAFMYIFNVPINTEESEIELYTNIDDLLKSINIKSLKHYITRPPKTSN